MKGKYSIFIVSGIYIASIVAIIGITVLLLIPQKRIVVVTDMDWQYSIAVEEYRTVREHGWTVPPGGRVVSVQLQVHHNEYVIIGYQNGWPIYANRPVWLPMYYYDIDLWVYDHTESANAHDKKPFWPKVNLISTNQREGERTESYGISATYKNKESHYELDYNDWRRISVGDRLHVEVHGSRIDILDG